MIPASLRWRLPLSYALIALLTAVALNIILLTTLRSFYQQQELNYLTNNARAIGRELEPLLASEFTVDSLPATVKGLAFLSQARVQVLEANKVNLLADSGASGLNGSNTQLKLDIEIDGVAQSFSQSVVPGIAEPNAVYTSSIVLETDLFNTNIEETVIVQSRETILGETAVPQSRLPVRGTLFGFGFSPDATFEGDVSDLIVQYPMFDKTGTLSAYVQLSEGPAYGREILDSVLAGGLLASVLAVLVAAVAGWLASRRLTKPLTTLTEVTQQMAAGDLSVRTQLNRRDELGTLGNAFNQMAQRIQDIVTTLQQFVADAAHELHTPLTALQTNLELLQAKDDADVRVGRALAQATRLQSLTNSLLDLSRLEGGQKMAAGTREQIDLGGLLQTVSERYASQAEQKGISFHLEACESSLFVFGNRTQLHQAINNLLDNSLKFTSDGDEIVVAWQRDERGAAIEIADTGIGIPVEDQSRLFGRFHRGHNTAAYPGSGLGLAIVKAIVEAHNGRLQINSLGHGQGCIVTMWLPLALEQDE